MGRVTGDDGHTGVYLPSPLPLPPSSLSPFFPPSLAHPPPSSFLLAVKGHVRDVVGHSVAAPSSLGPKHKLQPLPCSQQCTAPAEILLAPGGADTEPPAQLHPNTTKQLRPGRVEASILGQLWATDYRLESRLVQPHLFHK